MVKVFIKSVGSTRKQELEVPEDADFFQFRDLVSQSTGLPSEQLSLVLKGKALRPPQTTEPSKPIPIAENDTVFAAVKPRLPPSHVQNRNQDGIQEEDEEDDLKFEPPPPSSKLQHTLATFLREKLHFPDFVLILFFWFSLRTWLLILLWCCMAPVVHHYLELGPIYVLSTCFALIFLNLGTRKPGEASAYSIFNEGFRELPGTLNAERLDNDIRAGQF